MIRFDIRLSSFSHELPLLLKNCLFDEARYLVCLLWVINSRLILRPTRLSLSFIPFSNQIFEDIPLNNDLIHMFQSLEAIRLRNF